MKKTHYVISWIVAVINGIAILSILVDDSYGEDALMGVIYLGIVGFLAVVNIIEYKKKV